MRWAVRVGVVLLLLALSTARPLPGETNSDVPNFCCFTLISEPIPEEHIVAYYRTDSRCRRYADVFVTVRSVNVCVDPNQPWAIGIKNNLDKKKSPP
uniref:Chemokine interleukin-8-like domain-containing protein n=1 Tax=Salarias fasciatus TaxID=181472 RepID=A0A672GW49_SALFA